MNIQDAITLIKQGKIVTNHNWNINQTLIIEGGMLYRSTPRVCNRCDAYLDVDDLQSVDYYEIKPLGICDMKPGNKFRIASHIHNPELFIMCDSDSCHTLSKCIVYMSLTSFRVWTTVKTDQTIVTKVD